MGLDELYQILSSIEIEEGTNIQAWYDHFIGTPDKPNITPPFILYRVQDASTLKADDKVHYQNNNYIVDLITEVKDVALETQLEQKLNDNYLPYDKEENYITSEQIYQIRYFL